MGLLLSSYISQRHDLYFRFQFCLEFPIGAGKKGRILFRKKDGELAWFDLSNKMIEEIDVKQYSIKKHLSITYSNPYNFCNDHVLINRLHFEVELFRNLSNKYIIVCYSVCKDDDHGNINFITEVCTSGNLRNYRKKRRHVLIKAFKKWSKQVLEGLDYLHAHDHQGI
ncbi:tyrosine kinase family protein [Medicago truncatula]|uniref:non-specific serine/threonine protein kinase n=1 Tax=Medicago truncatula TaxID=3880 RepID=A0A072UET6_MEDTR|nr:tyrosine kinase family protein [Medicago truncatula]